MAMVGGLDLHRRQITFDAVEVESGEEWRGWAHVRSSGGSGACPANAAAYLLVDGGSAVPGPPSRAVLAQSAAFAGATRPGPAVRAPVREPSRSGRRSHMGDPS
jgi:hypothetical protein